MSFSIHLLRGRWFSLFASFLIMADACAHISLEFTPKDIKTNLGYDQTTLNLIGSFRELAANGRILSGLIAEIIPTWFVLLIGTGMDFKGYLMIWLSITGKIHHVKVWQMCIYIRMGPNSQNLYQIWIEASRSEDSGWWRP